MKIKIINEQLFHVLETLRGVVEARSTLPASSMALFVPQDKGCTITAMNPEMELRLHVEEMSVSDPAPALVSVSKLYEISRNTSHDTQITLNFGDDRVTVASENGRFKLLTMPADDFPLSDEVTLENTMSIRQDDLKHVVEKTHFSMADHDARYYLNGMLIEVEGKKLTAVATDGHRLARSTLEIDQPVAAKAQAIMPRRVALELMRVLQKSEEMAELGVDSANLALSFGNKQINAKAINGQFPDYQRVIPTSFEQEIQLNRDETMKSLTWAGAIADAKSSSAKLGFSAGLLKLEVENPEGEQALIEQKIDYQGDPLDIGFNTNYLADVFRTLDTETVIMQIRDSSSGVRIVAEGSESEEYVVMPLRL